MNWTWPSQNSELTPPGCRLREVMFSDRFSSRRRTCRCAAGRPGSRSACRWGAVGGCTCCAPAPVEPLDAPRRLEAGRASTVRHSVDVVGVGGDRRAVARRVVARDHEPAQGVLAKIVSVLNPVGAPAVERIVSLIADRLRRAVDDRRRCVTAEFSKKMPLGGRSHRRGGVWTTE